jgi:ABC-type antimicrobial peptide transport system permease subunit
MEIGHHGRAVDGGQPGAGRREGAAGIVAFSVSSRWREIGLRVALGATRRDVLRMIVLDGLRPVLAGLGADVLLALGLSQMLSTLLFQTSVTDPVAFVGVGAFLLVVALIAGYLPARAVLRVDPTQALHAD